MQAPHVLDVDQEVVALVVATAEEVDVSAAVTADPPTTRHAYLALLAAQVETVGIATQVDVVQMRGRSPQAVYWSTRAPSGLMANEVQVVEVAQVVEQSGWMAA